MAKERPWVWWALMAALVAVPALAQGQVSRGGAGAAPGMVVMARYAVGLHRLNPSAGEQAFRRLRQEARGPRDLVRLVAVEGEILGPASARDRIGTLLEAGMPERLEQDLRVLQTVYGAGPGKLPEEDRARLRERYGWYGDLALSRGLPADDPLRRAALAPAMRTTAAFTLGGFAAVLGLIVGVVLVIVFLRRRVRGTWQDRLRPLPRREGDTVLLQTVCIFLTALLFLSTLLPWLLFQGLGVRPGPWAHYLPWLVLPAFLWPRVRGFDRDRWARDLGVHRGEGVLREIGCGLAGYVAALPLLALGLLASAWLSNALGLDPTHPFVEEGMGGSRGQLVALYAMACVWAPLFEEACFRGALYRYLRGRWGLVPSALLVAFVFAALHPQGLGAIPVLMAIAFALARLREWRGSLIACVTAHAVHNGVFLTLAVVAMR